MSSDDEEVIIEIRTNQARLDERMKAFEKRITDEVENRKKQTAVILTTATMAVAAFVGFMFQLILRLV